MQQQARTTTRSVVASAWRGESTTFTRHLRVAGTTIIAAAAVALVGELGAVLALVQSGGIAAARATMNDVVGFTVAGGLVGASLCLRADEDQKAQEERALEG